MNHLKQFQREEIKEFRKLILFPFSYLCQRDERLISLLKSQIEALDVSEMFSEQVKSEILKLL